MPLPEDRDADVRAACGMADVDRSGHADLHVRYLDAARHAMNQQTVGNPRHAGYLALDLQPGDHVLDVGCGLGQSALALAEFVGSEGRVVGLDASQTMIDEARRRAAGTELPVEFIVGNAHSLPFDDASFAACREELMLQHVADPAAAIVEMVRVTRSGGRVSATDPDWGL